jgi:hypothetical protein
MKKGMFHLSLTPVTVHVPLPQVCSLQSGLIFIEYVINVSTNKICIIENYIDTNNYLFFFVIATLFATSLRE